MVHQYQEDTTRENPADAEDGKKEEPDTYHDVSWELLVNLTAEYNELLVTELWPPYASTEDKFEEYRKRMYEIAVVGM